jgi:electron-transferring-flavoprotein dehydrogenase
VEIFPGFTAAEVLYNDDGAVKGVATGNMGVGKDGEPTENFQLGMELLGKYTVFAEGARGHLGKQLIAKYHLDEGRDPQSWGIGIKELWEIDPKRHQPGFVMHTAGWPMDETPTAAPSCTTWRATRSPWALSPAWATPTPT